MRKCYDAADDVFEFAAYILFQGLTQATYIFANNTDIRLSGSIVQQIKAGELDTT